MYDHFIDQIVQAYKTTGFRPQPKVWIDKERKECSPLVALALHNAGHEPFMSFAGKFYNDLALRRWVIDVYCHKNWLWVQGFTDAFNLTILPEWKDNESYHSGHVVGIEVRKRLKEIYYKKKKP